MANISNISAVIFDMDGTLVDSEVFTEPAIKAFCHENGIDDVNIDCSEFFGVSWARIEQRIVGCYPQSAGNPNIATRLHEIFHKMGQDSPPALVNQACESVIAAHALMPTAIISSSYRESIEETIRRMGIEEHVTYYAGADDYREPKPAPDGFLKAADALQIPPQNCLVFEDSIAGIQAARTAGMRVVAITHRSNDVRLATKLADLAVTDFSELDDDFFARISSET